MSESLTTKLPGAGVQTSYVHSSIRVCRTPSTTSVTGSQQERVFGPGLGRCTVRHYVVRKRSEEDSTGRMEWLEKNVRSDLRPRQVPARVKAAGREGVQGGSVVRVGDSGTDGGGEGGGRVEDATIFIRSDKNGQNQE